MFRFDNFTLDPDRFELTRDEEVVELQPRALKLLIRLVAARGALVTKLEIYEDVWEGRIVSEAALSSQIKALRRALGDTQRPYRIIATVHGQGFRIITDVRAASSVKIVGGTASPSHDLRPDSGRPAIAVLPLATIGSGGAHASIAEGLPDEVITTLSKMRWLRVTARGSSFRLRSHEHSPAEIGGLLKVDYSVSGTLEVAGDVLRIGMELAATDDDTVLWREQYELPVEGIHDLREEIVVQVAGRLEQSVTRNEIERLRWRNPDGIAPWEAYHLGLGKALSHSQPDYRAAERHFSQAVTGDPIFARAHAGLAQVHYWRLFQKEASDEHAVAGVMQAHANKALHFDPLDPFCHLIAGRSKLIVHDIDAGMAHLEQAKALSPSYALAYSGLGSIQALGDRPHDGIENTMMALKLSPHDPWKVHMYCALVAAYNAVGDHAEGARWAHRILEFPVRTLQITAGMMVTLWNNGDREEAHKLADEFRQRFPDATIDSYISSYPILSDELRRQTRDGMRALGFA